MENQSSSLDYWRKFFRSTSADIFNLIEKAILVAAADRPKEFKSRRDQIAKMLFTSRISRCFGCEAIELQAPFNGDDSREGCVSVNRGFKDKGRKVDDFSKDGVSKYSYDEAEVLTEAIEEENQTMGEVLKIKEALENSHGESEAVLYDSLRRLQLMQLSIEILKATEIGKTVNNLRKHKSKQIQSLIRTLIEGWKEMIDEWVKSTAAIADHSSDSVNPSTVDEEGLPSPPMDEGALFITHTTSMELSEFFDGMDEDGNFNILGEFNEKHKAGRVASESCMLPRRQESACQSAISKVKAQNMKHETVVKLRPAKVASEQNSSSWISRAQRKSIIESKQEIESSNLIKLEITKRKLQEGYQQIENAKKQRTIQLVELHDLPKQPRSQWPKTMNSRKQTRAFMCQ